MLRIETALVLLSLLIAVTFPTFGAPWFEKIEGAFSRLAKRRALAVAVIGISALALRAALLPFEPMPRPALNDEFSYLLMADTFAHGRLANPTHPMWTHFETFRVNQQPTYASMYYPAQGVFLALGQAVFGHPFWGVWLSSGLMCAALCWALQAWVPPSWAFLGGMLAIVRLGIFSYWANSYWGGAVAALGGALVMGAFPRIRRRQHLRDALVLAAGLAILANSRPYESIFFCAPILIALAPSLFKPKASRAMIRRVLLPISGIVLVTISAMGYYFWRCTGSPLRTPYVVSARTYEVAPFFPWQTLRPVPQYHDATVKEFYTGWSVQRYQRVRNAPVATLMARATQALLFFYGPLLAIPWLLVLGLLPAGLSFVELGYKTSLLTLICVVSIVGMALPIYFEAHYAAPVCCALYALEIQVLRRIRIWRWHRDRKGSAIVRNWLAVCVVLFALKACTAAFHISLPEIAPSWSGPRIENLARATIAESVSREPGGHLILVHYAADHAPQAEWVYNCADIDGSKVVWARDLGAIQNSELVRYFSNRKVWLLQADAKSPQLLPYSHGPTLNENRGASKITAVAEAK